jgi:MoxR-like ATPase
MAIPILRHRVLLNFHAESDKMTADVVLSKMIESVPVPRD